VVNSVAESLTSIYLYLLRRVANSPGCKIDYIRITNIKPQFKRIREIEDFSYLLIDRKAKMIYTTYYKKNLDGIKSGIRVELPPPKCIEAIYFGKALNITFRRARLFPTLYCDFIAIDNLCKELQPKYINLVFKNLTCEASAPYFKAVLDALGITEIHPECKSKIDYMTKLYYDIVKLEYFPRIGHILKLAAFYFAHVEKIITRLDARRLYYFLRYVNKLDPELTEGAKFGAEVYLRVLSNIRSNKAK
jgi:hypothetical protein